MRPAREIQDAKPKKHLRRKVSANAPRVRLRRPHDQQLRFLRSKAKRKVIRAGRRGGKTTGIAILAVEYFLAGRRVLYGAPTQEQVDAFWFEVKKALAEPIDAGYFRKNETKHTIERPGLRARIKAKTCWNADTLRGDTADLLILDEFQLMDESAWTIVGAPMLIDNDGDAVFIYTPPSAISKNRSRAIDPRYAAKLHAKAEKDESGRWAAFHFSSMANPYLSKKALAEISEDMSATAYRQEILAEELDEVPGALWTRKTIDDHRLEKAPTPNFIRVVVGVDPPGGATEAGIVCAAKALCRCKGVPEMHAFVLEDASREGNPKAWGTTAVDVYDRREADRILGEVNYGGDMVEATVKAVDDEVLFKAVRATRGKAVRAEPISALYEKGRVHHVGSFPKLEDEMCSWLPEISGYSPNRMDALVWALTELLVKKRKRAGTW